MTESRPEPGSPRVTVADLDRATAATAASLLRPSCASARWIQRLVSGRPYGTLRALAVASDATIGALGWPDIEQALAAHPRIGVRPQDGAAGDREASWSSQEQAGTRDAAVDLQAGLRAGNA
ncbi:MAG: 2-oxo-4-hydroxy-4-carboxy-5-ureidoimidazoline decarboxylase, partial [Streptosporangiaceae bacterium]